MKIISNKTIIVAQVFGQMLFLYGLLAWINGVVVQFVDPRWLPKPVSHLFLWLRTDTFTILMFIVSAIGFFIWRLAVELIKSEQNKATH